MVMKEKRSFRNVIDSLPPVWPSDLLKEIQSLRADLGDTVVVLDDDPTGTQTAHNVPVLTRWDKATLVSELNGPYKTIFILTNTRAMTESEARKVNQDIGKNLSEASVATGSKLVVISRSDSTLRGHFPMETDVLSTHVGAPDGLVIVPFFFEGGRYTIDDTHYVVEDDVLTPVAQTSYAKDRVFGFTQSSLPHWIEEKSNGRITASAVTSISLDVLRNGGPERVFQMLMAAPQGTTIIVNAVAPADIDVFVSGLLRAEAQGQRYLYRTAASFVKSRSGLGTRPYLSTDDIGDQNTQHGGLTIVGSYVPQTTSQLNELLKDPAIESIEVSVEDLLNDDIDSSIINKNIQIANDAIASGKDTVIYSSRKLISGADAKANLSIGRKVSVALVNMLQKIQSRPRYILAKGGITSSDLATEGLGVRRAMVRGQLQAGVSVWRLGPETRFDKLDYIVFPGNVGDTHALANAVSALGPTRKM